MEAGLYIGKAAISQAGHDKGQIFFIIREDGEYVYLVDGKVRTVDRPKKKKKKHVSVAEFWPDPGKDAAQMTDCEIKYLLKRFKRETRKEQVVRR